MSRQSLSSVNAVASTSKAVYRGMSGQAFRQLQKSHCLVVQDLPRTLLPSDVILALRKSGAIKPDQHLRLQDVVKQPPLPAQFAPLPLTSSFHITFGSDVSAKRAANVLSSQLSHLFFSPISSASKKAFLEHGGSNPPNAGQPKLRQHPKVWMSNLSGSLWYMNELRAAYGRLPTARGEDSSPPETFFQQSRIAPLSPDMRGRQVLLRGLPTSMQEESVWNLLKGFEVPDLGGVVRLPDRFSSTSGLFVITFPTISEAHRLVRKLHKTRCDINGLRGQEMRSNVRFLIKGEVLW